MSTISKHRIKKIVKTAMISRIKDVTDSHSGLLDKWKKAGETFLKAEGEIDDCRNDFMGKELEKNDAQYAKYIEAVYKAANALADAEQDARMYVMEIVYKEEDMT